MNTQDAFEIAARKRGLDLIQLSGQYLIPETLAAWRDWQDSAAADKGEAK